MSLLQKAQYLVFTDLDGSLLDHHSYSYLDALPQLHQLEHQGIPVIPATSKTRAEIAHLRGELGNGHPFIVENGAAIYIPQGYFDTRPAGTLERDGFWVREMAPPRRQWLSVLEKLYVEFDGGFDYFYRAGVDGIARMTGLPEARAQEANCREYTEPVKWLGDEPGRQLLLERLDAMGATVLAGGRFLSVSGDCDKGRALAWLRAVYRQTCPELPCHDLAIGDSGNDCAMLEEAQSALVVRSPVHDFPTLARTEGLGYSTDYGPAGWAEGVARWLQSYYR